jgi:RNA polymerase sigma-70 factor (sigma-E family)
VRVVPRDGKRKPGSAGATFSRPCRLSFVDTLETGTGARGRLRDVPGDDAASAVTALYERHAVSMIRIALIMLGDRTAAEDVVQDAFFGLYRRWARLKAPDNALTYVRSAVLNGCRDVLRERTRREGRDRSAAPSWQAHPSAEAAALISQDRQRVLAGIRLLPDRQREALVCRFYLGLSEDETARAMDISKGTVKSATSRALTALRRMLEEGKC